MQQVPLYSNSISPLKTCELCAYKTWSEGYNQGQNYSSSLNKDVMWHPR